MRKKAEDSLWNHTILFEILNVFDFYWIYLTNNITIENIDNRIISLLNSIISISMIIPLYFNDNFDNFVHFVHFLFNFLSYFEITIDSVQIIMPMFIFFFWSMSLSSVDWSIDWLIGLDYTLNLFWFFMRILLGWKSM